MFEPCLGVTRPKIQAPQRDSPAAPLEPTYVNRVQVRDPELLKKVLIEGQMFEHPEESVNQIIHLDHSVPNCQVSTSVGKCRPVGAVFKRNQGTQVLQNRIPSNGDLPHQQSSKRRLQCLRSPKLQPVGRRAKVTLDNPLLERQQQLLRKNLKEQPTAVHIEVFVHLR